MRTPKKSEIKRQNHLTFPLFTLIFTELNLPVQIWPSLIEVVTESDFDKWTMKEHRSAVRLRFIKWAAFCWRCLFCSILCVPHTHVLVYGTVNMLAAALVCSGACINSEIIKPMVICSVPIFFLISVQIWHKFRHCTCGMFCHCLRQHTLLIRITSAFTVYYVMMACQMSNIFINTNTIIASLAETITTKYM